MKRQRLRFGLRLLLLLVALCCVLSAYYRARLDLQREIAPLQLREWEYLYQSIQSPTKDDDPKTPLTAAELANLKARIAEMRQQIKEPSGQE